MNFIFPKIKPIVFSTLIILFCINFFASAQSVLLINSNTNVYNSIDESKYVLRKIDDETWVNYKGKNGEYIKVSNFFGKDEYYPTGIFEGFVHISSVLDTSTRKEYKNLISFSDNKNLFSNVVEQDKLNIESNLKNYDIGKLYLGMTKNNIEPGSDKSISFNGYNYNIQLSFNSKEVLTQILLSGKQEDALSVDTSIRDQIIKLKNMLIEKNGYPSQSIEYPSFLELEVDKLTSLAIWDISNKSVYLGIGESNDLYFPSVTFKVK